MLHGSADERAGENSDERDLLVRIGEGDRDAFGRLVERYLSRAVALAMRLLRHRQDAEDLVQDAFLKALQHVDSFDASRPFWPWLSRIIVNRGLDVAAARSRHSTEALADELFDRGPSPAETVERAEINDHLRRTLDTLPPRRRLVVQLYEVDGFSVAEIATFLDTAPATIRWHLHISRRQLRKALALLRGGG